MTDKKRLPGTSTETELQAFLQKLASLENVKPASSKGRLIFAIDATASREPTWKQACRIQGQMFEATRTLGGLEVMLCYYRGYQEFRTTAWLDNAAGLLKKMQTVGCLGGYTQIARVLQHAKNEASSKKVDALVFVGDCMEESIDHLCRLAGELGLLGVPIFIFQEGHDRNAELAFRQIAKLSKGAHCRFDANSAEQLRELLNAVAVYAAGGKNALERFSRLRGGMSLGLLRQIEQN
jgi:hypothetical protein